LIFSWQSERAARLRHWCEQIDARAKEGVPAWQTIRRITRRKRFYRCDPGRRVRISARTLDRVYRAWRASGRSDAAFRLGYVTSQFRFTARHWQRVAKAAADPELLSLAAIWRAAFKGASRPSEDTFCRHLTAATRAQLRVLFNQRRNQRRAAQRVTRLLIQEGQS
jgi:hypothetical protein